MVKDVRDDEDWEAEVDAAERLESSADAHKDAWTQTLEDMEALAEQRREDGWEAVTLQAGATGPETASQGETNTHGLSYVVPGNQAEAFTDAFERGEFPLYDVYRQTLEGRVFVVTELLDPDAEIAILVAGNFWRYEAGAMLKEAMEEETMYTHVRTLDRTHLGTFEHDGYEKFFPDPDAVIEAWNAWTG